MILTTSEHFGKQLRRQRLAQNLTQMEVAKRMKVSFSNLCHFEKGDGTQGAGNVKYVILYARALGFNEITIKLETDENTIQAPANPAGI